MPVSTRGATPPPDGLPNYAAGTWGATAAKDLIARGGREFFLPLVVSDPSRESRRERGPLIFGWGCKQIFKDGVTVAHFERGFVLGRLW